MESRVGKASQFSWTRIKCHETKRKGSHPLPTQTSHLVQTDEETQAQKWGWPFLVVRLRLPAPFLPRASPSPPEAGQPRHPASHSTLGPFSEGGTSAARQREGRHCVLGLSLPTRGERGQKANCSPAQSSENSRCTQESLGVG